MYQCNVNMWQLLRFAANSSAACQPHYTSSCSPSDRSHRRPQIYWQPVQHLLRHQRLPHQNCSVLLESKSWQQSQPQCTMVQMNEEWVLVKILFLITISVMLNYNKFAWEGAWHVSFCTIADFIVPSYGGTTCKANWDKLQGQIITEHNIFFP